MGELGERLRQAREAKGLTLEQVEEITRIRRRYLQALEEEDLGLLPGEVYIRGFLRNYALALGLDPEDVLAASGRHTAIHVALQPGPQEPLLDEPLGESSAGPKVMATLIGVMILVALGLGGWTLARYLGPAGPTPTATLGATETPAPVLTTTPLPTYTAAPTLTPVATATPQATATPATGVLLRLEVIARSWVRVTVDGRVDYEGNMEPGQVQEWQAREQIHLRTGNAGGLRIWYNGREERPIGGSGEVVERTWMAGAMPATGGPGIPPTVATPAPIGPPPSPLTPTATP